ncbi:MAG: RNA-binding S4 domain-containing protein [Nanoarchaeota archaeon]|nr:RNA-binding S4 domain-containing protein [Nanoarchaeota archaeon]
MNEHYIELNAFLKKYFSAQTGGQAKHTIRSSEVKVNSEIETRNKRKLHFGDIVEYKGQQRKVEQDDLKKTKNKAE